MKRRKKILEADKPQKQHEPFFTPYLPIKAESHFILTSADFLFPRRNPLEMASSMQVLCYNDRAQLSDSIVLAVGTASKVRRHSSHALMVALLVL